MLELTTPAGPVLLPAEASIQMEQHSPLFDEEAVRGQYSLDFTVPTDANAAVLGWPALPDRAEHVPRDVAGAVISDDGLPLASGVLRVRRAGAKTCSVNLLTGLSAVATTLKERSLTSYNLGTTVLTTYTETSIGGEPLGILLHANDTVVNPGAHTHVFASINNPRALADDGPTWFQVNPWLNSYSSDPALPVTGFQLYNSFTFAANMSDVGSNLFPMTPLPRLEAVLRLALLELGLSVPAQLLPGELSQLVLITPHRLPPITSFESFALADFVPDVTMAELLATLRTAFGLVLSIDAERRVTAHLRRDAVTEPAVVDLSAQLLGDVELEFSQPTGLTLTYDFDGDDQAVMAPTDYREDLVVQPPGANVADLPNYTSLNPPTYYAGLPTPEPPQIRLVLDEDAWYKGVTVATGAPGESATTWTKIGDNLLSFDVAGGGGTELSIGTPTAVHDTPDAYTFTAGVGQGNPDLFDLHGPMAAMAQRLQQPDLPEYPGPSKTIRLAFYRGVQPWADSVYSYPLVTPLNLNANNERVGDLVLRIDGADGLLARLLNKWLVVATQPVSGKADFYLSAAALAALPLIRKVRLHGVDYLIRKLSPVVPLRRAVTVELVRV